MSTLKEAAEHAVLRTPEDIRRERTGVLKNVEVLEQERRALLGAEVRARPALSAAIAKLREKIRILREAEPFAAHYPRLDTTPLSWRDPKGFPRLVLFRTDAPEFRIAVRRTSTATRWEDATSLAIFGSVVLGVVGLIVSLLIGGFRWLFGYGGISEELLIGGTAIGAALIPVCLGIGWLIRLPELVRPLTTLPKLPKKLRRCYADVAEVLRKNCLLRQPVKSVTLRAEFHGLIPEPVREKIRKARKEFTDVFLLAEPSAWSLEKIALLKPDPLVVGWDGASLWLIEAFDVTPVEDYVRREFTT